MRKTIILLAIMACLSVAARDRLQVGDLSIGAGERRTIDVVLLNDTAYCALQTDISLPAGLTICQDGEEYVIDTTPRSDWHSISSNLLGNGAIRVFVTSQNARPFEGNDGAVLTLTVEATGEIAAGEIVLSQSIVVEPDGTRHLLEASTARVNGGSGPVPGDATGDGQVDIADVNAIINIMLGKADQSPAGDMTGDGQVDIADVNATINIMLGKE